MIFNRLAALTLIVFFVFTIPACSNSEQKKEKHYKRALEYIKIDDPKAAVIELKNAIQIDAKFADARYQLALLYLKDSKPRKAFAQLQRTTSLDPSNLDAGVKVAEFYLLSRNKEESRKHIEKVLSVDPNYKDGLSLLANIELIDGNFDKAAETIDKAIKQDPANDKFFNIKGRIALATGKLDEAEEFFLKAKELKPDNFANHRTLLMFYEQKKDKPALEKQLTLMTSQFPDNPQLSMMLSKYYLKEGDKDKAEQSILKAIEIETDSIPFRLALADFYKNQRQFDKAEETLQNALLEFPDKIKLQVALTDLLFELRKFDKAQALMDTVLATSPANGGANLIKARFLIRERKTTEALEILTSLTDNYPKWAAPFYFTALANMTIGKIELAQKAIEYALTNDSSKDQYHAFAAQIYLMRGESDKARKEASIALAINRHNFTAAKILAKSFLQAKKFDKAIELILQLNKTVDSDVDLLGSLSMAYLGKGEKEKAVEPLTKILDIDPGNSKALALYVALTAGKDLQKGITLVQEQLAKKESAGHYILLGDLLVRNQQPEKALEAFKRAQELQPKNPQSYILTARLLKRMGKIKETEQAYQELLKAQPDSIAGNMGLATIYENTERTAEAKEIYADLLKKNPDIPAAANNLAWLIASEKNGDLGEALRLAMQAKQALPEQPYIADTLGWVHYKRESYSLAISQFRQALEKRADDPVLLYHLALALQKNENTTEAITTLEKALAGKQDFKERAEAQDILKSWNEAGGGS